MTAMDDIGGEARLRDLVERFYDLVEALPEGANLRHLHARGHGVAHARTEQFNFLSGFLGGRQYYKEKYGHMDIKQIHSHIPIRTEDAENWLMCMRQALVQEGHVGPHADKLNAAFTRVASILINDVEA